MGNFRALITGTAISLVASTGFAQALDPARMELFRTILQGNDCALTEAEANIIFPQFDFSQSETREIVGVMIASGEVRLDGSTLNLTDGSCGGSSDVADLLGRRDVQQFIAIMAENNCALSEARGEEIFTARGISKAEVSGVVGPMMQAGMASFDAAQGVLSVNSAFCSPVMTATEEAPEMPMEAPAEGDLPARVAAIFAAQDCRIPVAEANAVFTSSGMRLENALATVGAFIASGQVVVGPRGDMIADESICSSNLAQATAPVESPAETAPTPPVEMAAPLVNDGSPEGMLLSYIVQQGCSIEAGAENLYEQSGVRQDQAFRIVDQWVASGEANLMDGGSRVQVDLGLCDGNTALVIEQATPVSPPAAPVGDAGLIRGDDPRAGLLAMLAQNNCEISLGGAAAVIGDAGLDYNTSMGMLSRMMASGEASSPDGGQTLQVSAPLCTPAVAAVPSTPREVFIELLKQNNCRISAAEFSTLLPVDGLDANAAFAMISELEAEGVISLPATRDVVTLSAEMCR